ncbi:unnamed protein product [Miscanthus lutarioriparius]|uniref:Uncharacterized protein n=1 Tax=Miscanthus lutarioriparius TaxID=422564 RepID=A0A811SH63_9POAL|nr:unnamed protein product [Miscanthus lutarioriparius]
MVNRSLFDKITETDMNEARQKALLKEDDSLGRQDQSQMSKKDKDILNTLKLGLNPGSSSAPTMTTMVNRSLFDKITETDTNEAEQKALLKESTHSVVETKVGCPKKTRTD